ncbi:MAG: Gfo/Idh/MocA family oxidoreductase [Alphaproteobacteria bacterium]|nr:Gfo/Idh/MocA family oxidoreductase [Alphaproteobacteria bacterium]
MTINLAIIGAGVMGADHARIFANEVPGVKLAAIVDADVARARKVADEYGASHVTADPLEVINSRAVAAVVVAAPDKFHSALTLACIAAGKPVLCEKPLSQDVGECLSVMSAEEKRGKRLVQVGFMRRFDPAYAEMKALLAGGAIGKALVFHCQHRNVSAAYDARPETAIANSAPHEFDVARWLLETEFTAVSVFRPGGAAAPATVPVQMVLETAGGALVNLEVNINAAYGYDVRGELVGEKGSIELRNPDVTSRNAALARSTAYPADWRPRFAEAYRRQNIAWVKSLEQGKPSHGASAWDGTCSTLTAEAGVKALQSGARVEIALPAKPGFYATA